MKTIQKRIISFIVSLCIFAGTVPLLSVTSSAYGYDYRGYATVNTSYVVNLSNDWGCAYFGFTPTTTGFYTFFSHGRTIGDPYFYLTTVPYADPLIYSIRDWGHRNDTARSYALGLDDDSNGDYNFLLQYWCTAGTTYWLINTRYSVTQTNYYFMIYGPNYNTATLNSQSATTAGTAQYYNSTGYYGTQYHGFRAWTSTTSTSNATSITRPTRTGYTFGGYYTNTNGGGTQYINSSGTISQTPYNGTLYAQWTANTYTVTFNQQNGTGGSSSVTATYDSAMPSATMPTRTGYTFGGYWTGMNGTGTQYYNANGTSARTWDLTSATTLYAAWAVSSFTVTLDNNGVTENITATLGEHLPKITPPTVPPIGFEEMKFIGYFDENGTQYYNRNGTSARVWDIAENTTLYARWVNSNTLLNIPDDSDLDVQARVVNLTKAVYKIDIEWGDMKFEYNLATAVAWNPGTHKYDGMISAAWSGMDGYNNQVIVTNHSNADVLVSLDVTDNKLETDVEMEIYTIIDNAEEKAENLPLVRVPYNGASQNEADSVDSYLRLDGEPKASDIALLKNNHYTRVGTITVTIEPNGNKLTPLNINS